MSGCLYVWVYLLTMEITVSVYIYSRPPDVDLAFEVNICCCYMLLVFVQLTSYVH